MQMESTRRSSAFERSSVGGVKKPRLNGDLPAPDRPASNGRAASFMQRQPAASGSAGSRIKGDRDSESSDSVRGPYLQQQQHQELVSQYKTALAELTFNSKPIITNLTIIAGENLHAAKAIAATVCANILEVPTEQKLPSLYLLDSIVKNIGRDYIKYFAARLPEVFCKAYRQVDPAIHPGMRHLFGTWKGVFPAQALQIIEKELGFAPAANGSSSGTTTSRPDSQAQRPAHSIHVNPKYLERQRLQQSTRVKGAASEITGSLVSPTEDADGLERSASVSSGRPWADASLKRARADILNEPVREKNLGISYVDPGYGSDISRRSGLGTGRMSQKPKEQGLEKPWYESGGSITGTIPERRNGFDSKHGFPSAREFIDRGSGALNRSWKNSEEEEYMWDDMNSTSTVHRTPNSFVKDQWTPDDSEGMGFKKQLRKPDVLHDLGLKADSETSSDSLSTEDKSRTAFGPRTPSLWSQEMPISDGMRHSGSGRSMSHYAEGHHSSVSGLVTSSSTGRPSVQSDLGPLRAGTPSFSHPTNALLASAGPILQQRQMPGSTKPSMHQRSLSPSFSTQSTNQVVGSLGEPDKRKILPPADPRKSLLLGQMSSGSRNQFPQDSGSTPSHLANLQKLQSPTLQTSSLASSQIKNQLPLGQQLKSEIMDSESSAGGLKSLRTQISGLGNHPRANVSPDYSYPPVTESPRQSHTSSLLADVMKSGILSSSLLTNSLSKFSSSDSRSAVQPPMPTELLPSQFSSSGPKVSPAAVSGEPSNGNIALSSTLAQKNVERPPLPPGLPPSSLVNSSLPHTLSAVNSASNPVSSLLTSLVAKGLISASKKEPSPSTPSDDRVQSQSPDSGVASSGQTPISLSPPAKAIDLSITKKEPSTNKHAAELTDGTQSTTEIKNLIGFDFKADVIRQSHPAVINELLDDLPHRCSICGIRLRLKERLDRHLEWHGSRNPDQKSSVGASRKWYSTLVDWVGVSAGLQSSDRSRDPKESSRKITECEDDMVPADESQCVCLLCGELFEDFYSQDRDEWMFKGAVYMNISSTDGETRFVGKDAAEVRPIVHANCISESSLSDLGLLSKDIKLEEGA